MQEFNKYIAQIIFEVKNITLCVTDKLVNIFIILYAN